MPKNKGKGGKNRRRGKNENELAKRELDLKEEGQEYAQVTKKLGGGRVEAYCFDGKTRLAVIRGKMRKKVWINLNDIVLIGLRSFQDEKADVIQKYNPDEARRLKAQGHIPDNINIEDGGTKNDDDNMIAFANDNDDDNDLLEDDEDKIPDQPNRYTDFLSDLDSESESDEESDEEEDFDYKFENTGFDKSQGKKEINIDNI